MVKGIMIEHHDVRYVILFVILPYSNRTRKFSTTIALLAFLYLSTGTECSTVRRLYFGRFLCPCFAPKTDETIH